VKLSREHKGSIYLAGGGGAKKKKEKQLWKQIETLKGKAILLKEKEMLAPSATNQPNNILYNIHVLYYIIYNISLILQVNL